MHSGTNLCHRQKCQWILETGHWPFVVPAAQLFRLLIPIDRCVCVCVCVCDNRCQFHHRQWTTTAATASLFGCRWLVLMGASSSTVLPQCCHWEEDGEQNSAFLFCFGYWQQQQLSIDSASHRTVANHTFFHTHTSLSRQIVVSLLHFSLSLSLSLSLVIFHCLHFSYFFFFIFFFISPAIDEQMNSSVDWTSGSDQYFTLQSTLLISSNGSNDQQKTKNSVKVDTVAGQPTTHTHF